DGLSLTLTLVDNATFHDGEPVTSEDVKFSIETAQAGHPFKPMFAPVSSIDTPDDTTVVINLSQPHPALLLALTPPLLPVIPEHIFNDGQDMATHPRNSEDVIGSGPFKVVEFNPAEVIRLEANPDFFLGPPNFANIIIQTFPDENTLALSVENGEVHMAGFAGFLNIERMKGVDGLVTTNEGHHGLGALNWVEFNVEDPVLSSKEVRQAIAYAIDADRITALNGNVFPRSPSPIAITSPFFHEGIESYDFDTAKAAELLEAAGYPGGEGLELTIDYLPGPDAIQKNVAEYIVQALEEVGITTTINVSADFPTWAERVASGQHQMTMNNVWNWGDPVIGVHRSYLSSNKVGAIWTNNSGIEIAEVDALLDQAGQTIDVDERRELYIQFQDLIAEEMPIYWLNDTTFWQVYPENLQNPPLGIWGQMSPMHEMSFG
ncbi:MAG: ABC transporter substrate-binding protein, partial [Acidimicrobiia bacterium]|nr:ABC transporter substrate-binding protein [Acidimicrobiia bacterium]